MRSWLMKGPAVIVSPSTSTTKKNKIFILYSIKVTTPTLPKQDPTMKKIYKDKTLSAKNSTNRNRHFLK